MTQIARLSHPANYLNAPSLVSGRARRAARLKTDPDGQFDWLSYFSGLLAVPLRALICTTHLSSGSPSLRWFPGLWPVLQSQSGWRTGSDETILVDPDIAWLWGWSGRVDHRSQVHMIYPCLPHPLLRLILQQLSRCVS